LNVSSRLPVAYVDLETFKGHSYPDVLVSILIKTLDAYRGWLETSAIKPSTQKSWWQRLWGAVPTARAHNKKRGLGLVRQAENLADELKSVLMSPEESSRSATLLGAITSTSGVKASLTTSPIPILSGNVEASQESLEHRSSQQTDIYQSRKIEFIHRKILDFKNFFVELSEYANGPSFLLLDDLYHIRPADQASVLDYFHRITKGTNTWLKVGTIRHRTIWYLPGSPPMGIKLGDDADEIDLDVTLEKYSLTKAFLIKILEQFCRQVGIRTADLVSEGARDRLVLASGGVARDFLSLVRKSIEICRQRLAEGDEFRGSRIGAEDVNKAAGELDAFKQEDFRRDTSSDEEAVLKSFFADIRVYCLDTTKTNCILVDKDSNGGRVDMVKELVDLKFLHHVRGRVTVRDKPGKIYEAYMLDISQYSGERKRRNFDLIEFWEQGGDEKLRRGRLIFA